MEKSSLLALDAIDRAIGGFFVGRSVQRHPDRKCAARVVPDDLNGADGFAPGPLSNGLQALLSQRPVAQPDCLRLRHFAAVKVASLFISRQTCDVVHSIFDQAKTARFCRAAFWFHKSVVLFAVAEAPRPPSGLAGLVVAGCLAGPAGAGDGSPAWLTGGGAAGWASARKLTFSRTVERRRAALSASCAVSASTEARAGST